MHGGHFLPFALAASSAEPRPSDFRCPCHRINWVWALPWMWQHEIFIKIALLTYHGFNVSRPQTILWSLFIINIITITHSPHSPVFFGEFQSKSTWNPLCPEAPLLQTYNMSRSRHRTFFSVGVSHLWVKIGPLRVCVQKRESGWRKWLVIEQRASLRWAPPPATGHKVEQPASQHCLSSHWNCPQSKLVIVCQIISWGKPALNRSIRKCAARSHHLNNKAWELNTSPHHNSNFFSVLFPRYWLFFFTTHILSEHSHIIHNHVPYVPSGMAQKWSFGDSVKCKLPPISCSCSSSRPT